VIDGKATEWTIGELAAAAGVTVRTLHHYDRLGLLRPLNRTPATHRRYGAAQAERLYRIVALRSLGFPLPTIGVLLNTDTEDSLREVTRRQLDDVTQQLAEYHALRERLIAVLDGMAAENPPADQLAQIMEVTTMTVHLSRIYTRAGDAGETHLGDRSRVSKTDPRVEAYGDIDELNSCLGVAIATEGLSDQHRSWLRRIQNDLYDIGSDLAAPTDSVKGKAHPRVTPDYVTWLEEACDEANSTLSALRSFVLPGGTIAGAQIHVCRSVCRRAERHAFRVQDANPEAVRYLNRLSDLLFIIGRAAASDHEVLWHPGHHAGSETDRARALHMDS